jgi:IS5 family transposase
MCELLVGLPEVNVLGVDDDRKGRLGVHVESRLDQGWCSECGGARQGEGPAAGLIGRIQAAGIAPRTVFEDSTAVARQVAHRIGLKLRRRSEEAKADVLAITGELADLAEVAVEQARRVLTNARRVPDRPVRRLRRMLAVLDHLIDALGRVIAQTGGGGPRVMSDRRAGRSVWWGGRR